LIFSIQKFKGKLMFLKFKQFIIISSSLVQAMKSPRMSEPQIMIENLMPEFKAKDYRQ